MQLSLNLSEIRLIHCRLVALHDNTTQIAVKMGSVKGLLPDGIKPIPEPMLTNHQWDLTWGFFLQEMLKMIILDMSLQIANSRKQTHLPGANVLNIR